MRSARYVLLAIGTLGLPACDDADVPPPVSSSSSSGTPLACPAELSLGLEAGDPDGHPDPLGAAAAGEARAGRITDVSSVPQPAHGRQRIEAGDYLIANDKVAFVIEGKDESDGYATFGGDLLSVDRIGEDGLPLGRSYYIETLMAVSNEMVDPSSVTVVADGSDGGPAIVRVLGDLRGIPILNESLKALFPNTYGYPAALDWTLEPGAEKLSATLHMLNPTAEKIDVGLEGTKQALHGFFHYSQNQMVTEEFGYAEPAGDVAWVGFDAGASTVGSALGRGTSFAWRTPGGPLEFGIEQSGFSLFWGPGFALDPCDAAELPFAEVVAGEPGYDGLRQTLRRVDGAEAWRAITGVVRDSAAAPVANAWVHELDASGKYLSRTRTADDGTFTVHAPPGAAVRLVPQLRGMPPHAGLEVADDESDVELAFAPEAKLHVVATETGTGTPLPVRVQVIPARALPATPAEYGVLDEQDGRLHQEFAITGDTTLRVPPGDHRVIVSRGYEWELLDTEVTAAAGETVEVVAQLEHSVDTTGAMCADFHIHSFYSSDSDDPVDHKVRGALADGLDIPVSSEHEWVHDFQPTIVALGMTDWAFGMGAQELTTFAWGHFGVVPLSPDTTQPNNSAIPWVGHTPSEVFGMVHARPEKPALIVNHPSGGGFQAYFSSAGLDRETGTGNELWSDDFDIIEVFNDSDFESNRDDSVADWFALLNNGYNMMAAGSSDSHHLRGSPIGYPRTCLWFDHDDPKQLDPSAVRDVLLAGNSTISGGLYMTVRGPDGEMPGGTVRGAGPTTFTVTVRAPSWVAAETLETIVNGETVSTEPLLPLGDGTGKTFVNEVTVTPVAGARRSWVLFHARAEGDLSPLHPGRRPFAASNPIFIQ